MEHSLPSICIAFFQFCRSCADVVVVLVADAVEEIAAVQQCLCESFQFQLLLLLEVFRLPFALFLEVCVLCTLARRRFFSKRSVVFSRALFSQVLIHNAFKISYDRKKMFFPGGASSRVKIDEQEVVRRGVSLFFFTFIAFFVW